MEISLLIDNPGAAPHDAAGQGSDAVRPAGAGLALALVPPLIEKAGPPLRTGGDLDLTDLDRVVIADPAVRAAAETGREMLIAGSLETAQHSDDVALITQAICDALGVLGTERDEVLGGAYLHDIGKTAVPRSILDKPGPLNDDEWAVIHTHTIIGGDMMDEVEGLDGVADVVRHSHERWDGGGYPHGISGEQIPLGSRIVFCADTFHAIRSDRPYRMGQPAAAALAEIRCYAGTQFDPQVVEALGKVSRGLRIGTRKIGRSSRLSALLMMTTMTMGSSALAMSGIFGEPQGGKPSPSPASGCTTLSCSPILLTTDVYKMLGLVPPVGYAAHRTPAGAFGPTDHLQSGSGAALPGKSFGGPGPLAVPGVPARPDLTTPAGTVRPGDSTPAGGTGPGGQGDPGTGPSGSGGSEQSGGGSGAGSSEPPPPGASDSPGGSSGSTGDSGPGGSGSSGGPGSHGNGGRPCNGRPGGGSHGPPPDGPPGQSGQHPPGGPPGQPGGPGVGYGGGHGGHGGHG